MRRLIPILGALGVIGCGLHQPVLINNLARPGRIDLATNGVLAFQFADPQRMIMTFWACEVNAGERYQLNQDIEGLPARIPNGGKLTPYGQRRHALNDTPWVYFYELPPGKYALRHMHLEKGGLSGKLHYRLPIRSDTFSIEPGTVTYIGSHGISGTWGRLGLGFGAEFTITTSDSSEIVNAKLDRTERFGFNRLKRRAAVVAIRVDPR